MAYDAATLLGDLSIPALQASGSMKWNLFPQEINGHQTIPCFVAERDFATAQPIRNALMNWASNHPLGYRPPELLEEFQRVVAKYYASVGLQVSTTAVRPISDVMTAYDAAARIFTEPGTPITLLTPAYMNFVRHVFHDERPIHSVDMLSPNAQHNQWRIDWEALEQALSTGGMLVLVNPYNPVGKVYARGELEGIAELAAKCGVRVLSDEIHSPLTFEGHMHIPFAAVSDKAAEVAITTWQQQYFFHPGDQGCKHGADK